MLHPLNNHLNEIVSVSTEEFQLILSYFKVLHRKKHQFIIQEGQTVDREFWVISGCLRSYVIDGHGKEHIVQFAMENWWITDYFAFLNQTKARMHVDCLEDCELLYITYENKEKLSAEFLQMEKFWSKKTKVGYASLQNRILSLLKDSAKDRYEQFIEQYPQLLQRIPKKHLAAYLGVSRETLSRLYL